MQTGPGWFYTRAVFAPSRVTWQYNAVVSIPREPWGRMLPGRCWAVAAPTLPDGLGRFLRAKLSPAEPSSHQVLSTHSAASGMRGCR